MISLSLSIFTLNSEQNNAKIFKTPYIYVTICWCEFQKRDGNRFLTSVEEDDVYTTLLAKFRAIGSRVVGASPLTSNLATQCQHLRLDSRPVVEEGPLLGPEGKGGRGRPGGVKCRPLVEADTSSSDQVSAGERPVFHIFPVRFYDYKKEDLKSLNAIIK